MGYRRRNSNAGTWYARVHIGGDKGSPYKHKALGTADDKTRADGATILTYAQAIERAATWDPDDEKDANGPLTVAGAVEAYLDWFQGTSALLHAHQVRPGGACPTYRG